MGEFLDGGWMRWVFQGNASSSRLGKMDLKVCFASGSRGDKTLFVFFLCFCIKGLFKKKIKRKANFIVNDGFLLSSL